MMVKMPYRAEYTTYSGKHRNMKPNSKGSVTPQTNAQMAADTNQTDGGLLVLSGLDHSQSSTGNTEHHAGEEAGHIHTKAPAHISAGLTCPEVGQVAQTDGIEPEHVVQSVVQAGGDEQTVQEGVDAGADAVHASDAVAQIATRASKMTGQTNSRTTDATNGDQTGSDRNEALAGEECQPVRQLGILELVVAGSADNGGQNADKGVAGDLLECDVGSGTLFQMWRTSADHSRGSAAAASSGS